MPTSVPSTSTRLTRIGILARIDAKKRRLIIDAESGNEIFETDEAFDYASFITTARLGESYRIVLCRQTAAIQEIHALFPDFVTENGNAVIDEIEEYSSDDRVSVSVYAPAAVDPVSETDEASVPASETFLDLLCWKPNDASRSCHEQVTEAELDELATQILQETVVESQPSTIRSRMSGSSISFGMPPKLGGGLKPLGGSLSIKPAFSSSLKPAGLPVMKPVVAEPDAPTVPCSSTEPEVQTPFPAADASALEEAMQEASPDLEGHFQDAPPALDVDEPMPFLNVDNETDATSSSKTFLGAKETEILYTPAESHVEPLSVSIEEPPARVALDFLQATRPSITEIEEFEEPNVSPRHEFGFEQMSDDDDTARYDDPVLGAEPMNETKKLESAASDYDKRLAALKCAVELRQGALSETGTEVIKLSQMFYQFLNGNDSTSGE